MADTHTVEGPLDVELERFRVMLEDKGWGNEFELFRIAFMWGAYQAITIMRARNTLQSIFMQTEVNNFITDLIGAVSRSADGDDNVADQTGEPERPGGSPAERGGTGTAGAAPAANVS